MVGSKKRFPALSRPRRFAAILAVGALVWSVAHPRAFLNLWLTPDQQGWIWYELGEYERASRAFENPRWRGFSQYAGQNFAAATRYFSSYQDADSLLIRANAMAHQRDYVPAKRAYEEMAKRYPEHPAPAVNLKVVEALIEANQRMSESQASEGGDIDNKPDEGPRSSDGDERKTGLELERYSADQLLNNPELAEMWLRQIQRDPSEFLTTKFYLQLEREAEEDP